MGQEAGGEIVTESFNDAMSQICCLPSQSRPPSFHNPDDFFWSGQNIWFFVVWMLRGSLVFYNPRKMDSHGHYLAILDLLVSFVLDLLSLIFWMYFSLKENIFCMSLLSVSRILYNHVIVHNPLNWLVKKMLLWTCLLFFYTDIFRCVSEKTPLKIKRRYF